MPIRAPGYKPVFSKHGAGVVKKNVVAMLSLTAMVDMFTVLVVFLLQNYNPETGAVLDIPQEVKLPKARVSKELKPAHVVIISPKGVALGKKNLVTIEEIRLQEKWMIRPLFEHLRHAIALAKKEKEEDLSRRFQDVVDAVKLQKRKEEVVDDVTVQADKETDFHIIKKVMFTLTEAGASEINFAVMQSAKR